MVPSRCWRGKVYCCGHLVANWYAHIMLFTHVCYPARTRMGTYVYIVVNVSMLMCYTSLIFWNCMTSTETGGVLISPRPSPDNHTPKPGYPMRPFFGIDPLLVDDKVPVATFIYQVLTRVTQAQDA